MIEILYPPGCYGNYLIRSLYNYTDLRVEDYTDFLFDNSGSSHLVRFNSNIQAKFQSGHLSSYNYICPFELTNQDQLVVILPCEKYKLDYYNNQFFKNYNGFVEKFILSQLPINEINKKLFTGWNWDVAINRDPPTWIQREFMSLWMVDCLNNGYSIDAYKNIPCAIKINTQDIFLNFLNLLHNICQALDLKINVIESSIVKNHGAFLKSQQFYNSQINCEHWVDSIIHSNLTLPTPCKTIFDQAYVQHLLRQNGYEIQCNGLEVFPATSTEMKLIIYKS